MGLFDNHNALWEKIKELIVIIEQLKQKCSSCEVMTEQMKSDLISLRGLVNRKIGKPDENNENNDNNPKQSSDRHLPACLGGSD